MEKNTLITITAVSNDTSDTMSRTFSTTNNGIENNLLLKEAIIEWKTEIPYRRYCLMTDEDLSDYSTEILQVLDELEITD